MVVCASVETTFLRVDGASVVVVVAVGTVVLKVVGSTCAVDWEAILLVTTGCIPTAVLLMVLLSRPRSVRNDPMMYQLRCRPPPAKT